ncbi:UNVERIFIED_CONTAM: hypothetical protein FKN15_003158 [Acipenser sinensis]
MRVKESFHRVKGLRVCFLGIGRWTNPEYVQFITILEETKKNNSPQNKEGTVSRWRGLAEARAKTQRGDGQRSELCGKAALSDYQCGGQRAKLVACDGNDIDTMFVDKRNSQGEKGKKLVSI